MSSVARKLLQVQPSAEAASDDDFANVVLLLDGDGTSGDDNNTFTDSSTNGFTVTESGSVVQGSFSPYGDHWSNYLGPSNKIKTAGSSDFAFGTGDFSVECWFNAENLSQAAKLLTTQTNDTVAGAGMWYFAFINSTTLRFGRHGSPQYVDGATSFSENTWHHIHVSRVSSTVRMFVDGVSLTLTNTGGGLDTYNFNSGGVELAVAYAATGGSSPSPGYLSNARIIKGTSSENKTADFTPPTEPLTAVTNTVLLTCQSNRFVDNSSSSRTMTPSGTPKVTPFSPFKNDDARTLTTDGGSAYFGSGNKLKTAGSSDFAFGTGDFSIECWVNAESFSSIVGLLNTQLTDTTAGAGMWYLQIINSTTLRFGRHGSPQYVDGAISVSVNTWHHVHVSRVSSTVRLFVDGVSLTLTNTGGGLDTYNFNSNGTNLTVGYAAANNPVPGYLSNVRIIKGTSSENKTSNFTPSTAPLTAVTNTVLLLNFQDAGIYDRSGLNNIDTVGNAQIDTAVKKYGTGSMEFDGTGDYLKTVENEALELGSGDWTIEFWVYFDAVNNSTVKYLFDWRTATDTSNSFLAQEGTNNWTYWNASGSGVSSGFTSSTFSASTWHHVAIAREGSNIYFFVDGTKTSGSVSDTSNYDSGTLVIGSRYNGQNYLDGYIDDLRITKGIARYTSNFTPPDAALGKF